MSMPRTSRTTASASSMAGGVSESTAAVYVQAREYGTHEASDRGAHLTAVAHPRDRARLPGAGRVGAADAGRPRRLRAARRAGAAVPQLVARRARAVRDPLDGRAAAAARSPAPADAARPAPRGAARDGAARRYRAVHAAVLHRRRVGAR